MHNRNVRICVLDVHVHSHTAHNGQTRNIKIHNLTTEDAYRAQAVNEWSAEPLVGLVGVPLVMR